LLLLIFSGPEGLPKQIFFDIQFVCIYPRVSSFRWEVESGESGIKISDYRAYFNFTKVEFRNSWNSLFKMKEVT